MESNHETHATSRNAATLSSLKSNETPQPNEAAKAELLIAIYDVLTKMEALYPRTMAITPEAAAPVWTDVLFRHNVPAAKVGRLFDAACDRRLQSDDSARRAFAPEVGDLVYEWVAYRVAQQQRAELTRTSREIERIETKTQETTQGMGTSGRERFFAKRGAPLQSSTQKVAA